MSSSRRIQVFLFLAVYGCLLVPKTSEASGFSTARFGAEHGNPVTTNPTAIYYNPAGLALSDGTHLFFDTTVAFRSASYRHTPHWTDEPEPAGAEGANTDEATLFNVVAAPMFGASTKIGDVALGTGVFVPFGGSSVWDKNERFENQPEFPGPYDGANRWFAVEGSVTSMYFSLGAAYEVPNTGLSIGLSANLIRSVVDSVRARVGDGSNSIATEGRTYIDVSGWQFGFGAGLMYEAVPDALWFGLSYQSKPNVVGGMVLEGDLWNALGQTSERDDIELHQDLPDVIRLGVRYRFSPAWEMRIHGDWTRWHLFKQQCLGEPGEPCEVDSNGKALPSSGTTQNIPRHWNDSFGVRAGGSFFPVNTLELIAGIGYDGNAVPDTALEPSLMDFHDFSASVGARLQLLHAMHVALTYTEIFYLPRDNSGESVSADWHENSRSPDSGGEYEQSIRLLNANVELTF